MFCPNCGNRISESDNYCSLCGKNLKNVKVSVKNLNENSFNGDSAQETRIFKPIAGLDEIDSSRQLKDIIKAVDKQISKNISDYEKQSKSFQDTINPKKAHSNLLDDLIKKDDESSPTTKEDKQTKDEGKNFTKKIEPIKKEDSNNGTTDSLKKDDSPKKDSKNLDIIKKNSSVDNPVKKKRSLKQLWKDFINEDDDEFSIFSSESKPKEPLNISNADVTFNNIEDTMGVSVNLIEEELKKHNLKDSNLKDKTAKEYEEIFGSIKDDEFKKSKPKKNPKPNYKEKEFKNKPDSLTYKSFTEIVNESLEKEKKKKDNGDNDLWESESKESESSDKVSPSNKSKINDSETIVFNDDSSNNNAKKEGSSSIFNKNLKGFFSGKKSNTGGSNKVATKGDSNYNLKLNDTEEFINNKLSPVINKSDNKNMNKILFVLAAIITILPILISERTISFTILLLFFIKFAFKLLQYYFALNVASEYSWIDTNSSEIKFFSLVNFLVCESIMFVLFLLSPFNGFFNFTLINALSPMPIATILLLIISVLVAASLFYNRIEKKIDFFAWYLIVFGLIEAFEKLIFIFINVLMG